MWEFVKMYGHLHWEYEGFYEVFLPHFPPCSFVGDYLFNLKITIRAWCLSSILQTEHFIFLWKVLFPQGGSITLYQLSQLHMKYQTTIGQKTAKDILVLLGWISAFEREVSLPLRKKVWGSHLVDEDFTQALIALHDFLVPLAGRSLMRLQF